jgi:hypothetical protein
MFFLLFLLDAGSGSVSLTNGSGSGRPKTYDGSGSGFGSWSATLFVPMVYRSDSQGIFSWICLCIPLYQPLLSFCLSGPCPVIDISHLKDLSRLAHGTYLDTYCTWCVVSRNPGRGVVNTYVLCCG